MEKKKLGYLSSLDLLRGLAAVAVCYFHFTHGNPDFLSKTNILYQSGRYGFLGVDVFFVISGFVIPYAMYRGMYRFKNFGTFLLKRVIRIEPPFFAIFNQYNFGDSAKLAQYFVALLPRNRFYH